MAIASFLIYCAVDAFIFCWNYGKSRRHESSNERDRREMSVDKPLTETIRCESCDDSFGINEADVGIETVDVDFSTADTTEAEFDIESEYIDLGELFDNKANVNVELSLSVACPSCGQEIETLSGDYGFEMKMEEGQ